MATDPVIVEIGAKIDKLTSAVDQVKGQLSSLTAATGEITAAFGKVGDMIKAAFSIEAIISFIEKMGELGLSIEKAQAQLGGSTQDIVNLSGMAQLAGLGIESFTTAMERMSLGIMKSTKDGMTPAADALRVLGINAQAFLKQDLVGRFDMLQGAVSKFNPSLNLTNAVMTAGGRGVAQLMLLLQQSGEEWTHLKQRVEDARAGVADATAEMAQAHINTTLLSQSVQSLSSVAFAALGPVINSTINYMSTMIQKLRDQATAGTGLGSVLMNIVVFAAKSAATAFVVLTSAVMAFGTAVAAVYKLAAGDISEFSDIAKQYATDFEDQAIKMKKTLTDIWNAPAQVTINKGGGLDARAVNEGLQKAMSEQLRIIQENYKQRNEEIQTEYGNFIFTENAKTQALIQSLKQRYDEELKAGENSKVAQAKFAADYAKIIQQSTKEFEKDWDQAFQGLQSSFNSQLRGLLAGTTSFKDAFKAILGDMVIWFIEQIEKMVFKWIAHEIAKTAASATGDAARTASTAAAAATDEGVQTASAIGTILRNGAVTFSGVFANLSWLMGPAAAGPAAAAEATVDAQAFTAAAATGTDYVARTGLVTVHQGESIVPASFNPGFTGDLLNNAGGHVVSISINALDSKSFSNMINNNSGMFMDLIKKAMRNNQMPLASVTRR